MVFMNMCTFFPSELLIKHLPHTIAKDYLKEKKKYPSTYNFEYLYKILLNQIIKLGNSLIVLLWGKIRHKGKKENICGLKTAFKKH